MADRRGGNDLPDPALRTAVETLRDEEHRDPQLAARIMDAVRREPPPITRPKVWGRIAPAMPWAVVAAAAAVGAVLLATSRGDTSGAGEGSDGSPRSVQFVLVEPTARRVALVGDFNNWDLAATPLSQAGAAGVWSVELALPPGRHEYAFVVDEREWRADQGAPRAPAGDFGTPSSVILVDGDGAP